ncbi:hypothetical protein GCM10022252_19560 [Streptosporangium oxazolinicum]|uniref:Uncharacterized protein n=1 Tax=Streptosporangium oxazolinicum TaxID=909287 RepID=A0ABP8ANR4_9ACTN
MDYDEIWAKIEAASERRGRESSDEALRAYREDLRKPPPPPSVIPEPENLGDGVLRFRCPICPWYYDEQMDSQSPGRVMLSADFTAQDLIEQLAVEGEARTNALLVRTEREFITHYADKHPGR